MPIDLRTTPLAAALQGIVDFTSPIFIAWEGMSMYFEEAGSPGHARRHGPLAAQ